eukprot:gene13240-biopygen12545
MSKDVHLLFPQVIPRLPLRCGTWARKVYSNAPYPSPPPTWYHHRCEIRCKLRWGVNHAGRAAPSAPD